MRSWIATLAVSVLFLSAAAASAQEAGKDPKKTEKFAEPTDREKKVLALFNASTKGFKDGKIYLEYDFEKQRAQGEDLVRDWKPTLAETRNRIRWARGAEGTWTTIEHGLVVGDMGQWIHKALFLPDLEVKAEFMKVSQVKAGSMLGPIFLSEKKKLALGSNGVQALCLNGARPTKPGVPKSDRPLPPGALRHSISYKYDGKVLEFAVNGKKAGDTSATPKFTEGFESGRAGIAWGPSVQSFLFKVTIEGKLDPEWVAKELGEEPAKTSTALGSNSRRR